MIDLKELAAKCSNPVVRNALLAAAKARATEKEKAKAGRIAARQKSLARRKWSEAIEGQSASLWGGLAAGRKDDPAWAAEMEEAIKRTEEARRQFEEAERATDAIRALRDKTEGA